MKQRTPVKFINRLDTIEMVGYQHSEEAKSFTFSTTGRPEDARSLNKRQAAFSAYKAQYQDPDIPFKKGEMTVLYWAADKAGLIKEEDGEGDKKDEGV